MKLNFRAFGDGPPLVILHGLLGSLDNWVPHAQKLSARFQVFLLDLRNHGHSPHADEFNYDVMAADLSEFLHDQHLARASLLGHSMGGKVAMRFAQSHPDSVQKLVVVDMSPREYAPRYAGILYAMHALDLSQLQHRTQVDAALTVAAPDKSIRQFLLKNIGRDETGAMRWKPNIPAIRANYAKLRSAIPATSSFTGPTLFVRGGKSDYLRDEDVPQIQQCSPAQRWKQLPPRATGFTPKRPRNLFKLSPIFCWPKCKRAFASARESRNTPRHDYAVRPDQHDRALVARHEPVSLVCSHRGRAGMAV